MSEQTQIDRLSIGEYQALLRQDFTSFILRCFAQLNPQTQFLMNWHIAVIAATLEACRRGEIRRLIINLPPRHLKSICASVAFPAWLLGHNPAAQIMCVSYAQDLSDKLARDCRTIMNAKWYQKLFGTRPASRKPALQEFETRQHGYRLATSVGGVLTGRGADFIIIDDPLKADEATSETQRCGANEWFDRTLYSRLNSKETGCIILIMQRLHEDDLVGHVLEQEDWKVLSFPAIAEKDEEFVVETPIGGRTRFSRREGDVLHPERESREVLDRTRRALGEYDFAGQYQQTPAPLGGGMVKVDWFPRFWPDELPDCFDQIVQSWDTANKVSELSNYSVCTTWGIKDSRIYLLHVLRQRMDYPELKRAVREQWQECGATVVLIEDRASGTQLIQELKVEGVHAVTGYTPEGDKIMRMHAQTATIENGSVYLPQGATWLASFLQELTTFPKGKYDDQVDSTSQALAWIKQAPPEHTIFAYHREQIAISLHRQGFPIEVIAAHIPKASLEQIRTWIEKSNRG
jgi:predicted phage terminase large subunit-like protein